jgi:hypothetical protein
MVAHDHENPSTRPTALAKAEVSITTDNIDNVLRKHEQKQMVEDRPNVIGPKITPDNVDNAPSKNEMKTDI